jgi:pimeloyl-ACP methyl ester carboxylesterase
VTFANAEHRLEEENPAMTSPDRTLQWASTPDGRALCFAEYGDPAGRPVFFMHGGPGCRLLSTTQRRLGYEELMAELGVRLVRHDRPGFGRSDRHRGRRMTDTAADVATIADVLGLGQFAVVGGSGGTGHALATAATLAERVSRVAVTAPAAPYAVVGHDTLTAGMSERVQAYFEAIRNGEDAMNADFGAEDAELRAGASADEPDQAWIFEETRQGLGG